jgi:hypothetical protein
VANEPDIVQKLSVDFNVVNNLDVDFTLAPQSIDAQFGTIYVVGGGDCKVLYATTATWNSQPQLISARGYIYIYSDYKCNSQGKNIPCMKVGDGQAYLIDMPFVEELMYGHIEDNARHITQEDRAKWDNKVRCYVSEVQGDNLIFTTE